MEYFKLLIVLIVFGGILYSVYETVTYDTNN